MDVAFDASRRRHSQSYRHDAIIGFEGAFTVVAGYLLSVRPRCYFPFEIDLGHALSSGFWAFQPVELSGWLNSTGLSLDKSG